MIDNIYPVETYNLTYTLHWQTEYEIEVEYD